MGMSPDRLRALMRPGSKGVLALVLSLALVGVIGCGNDVGKEGEEGVPIQLGQLEFNVQLTRFLNPADSEDREYLAGQQVPTPAGKSYLAVFMTIKNHGSDPARLPTPDQMSIVDTTGVAYAALPSSTDFAVPLGSVLEGGGQVPEPGTAAASGPTQGGIVLFLVDQGITENRPLDLEIQHEGETGTIKLDI
jgi:hypothetical protein